MKKISILFAACTICAELAAAPSAEIKDTTAFEQLYEAVVSATRAPQSARLPQHRASRKYLI